MNIFQPKWSVFFLLLIISVLSAEGRRIQINSRKSGTNRGSSRGSIYNRDKSRTRIWNTIGVPTEQKKHVIGGLKKPNQMKSPSAELDKIHIDSRTKQSPYPMANYPRQSVLNIPRSGTVPMASSGIPSANYPRQPGFIPPLGSNGPQTGGGSDNYPKLPGPSFPTMPQPSLSNYPKQSGPSFPQGGTMPQPSLGNYPKQPGSNLPQGGTIPQPSLGNYPKQPGSNFPQGGTIPQPSLGNYPKQPGSSFPQGGTIPQPGLGNYPKQPGSSFPQGGTMPQPKVGIPSANYPRQPGVNFPQSGPLQKSVGGMPSSIYPKQSGMSKYPREPPPSYISHIPLGGNIWKSYSGYPSPPYMNFGGLPTGANMATKPYKNKGLLGSLFAMGVGSKLGKKHKYYGSYPSPYGVDKMAMSSFLGRKGSTAAMYTILPYMATKAASKLFRPRFGFMPIFLPNPFGHLHHHNYIGYDIFNRNYAGKCNRPIPPVNGKLLCNSTYKEVNCDVTCETGFSFPDYTLVRQNKCWHVAGVWMPEKNFPECIKNNYTEEVNKEDTTTVLLNTVSVVPDVTSLTSTINQKEP